MNVAQPGGPNVRPSGFVPFPTYSENWSGYGVVSKKQFTSVSSTFVQPAVKCTGAPHQMTSNWVGLDGFANQTVEQDGTSAACDGTAHTTPTYVAWIEMYPLPSQDVFKVNPGDIIQASVNYTGGQFVLSVTDETTGKTKSVSDGCATCARASAEWIIERPAYCNSSFTKCDLFALPNFGTSTMAGDTASLAGGPVENANKLHAINISMIQPLKKGFITLDTVSALDRSSFTATFDRSGTPLPITLGPKS